MACLPKSAAAPPHPSAAELLAECAALPLGGRIKFAAEWGQLNRRPDAACLSPLDRAAAELLALSLIAWLTLREGRAGLARKGEKGARIPFAFYLTAVRKAEARAESAGLALPT